VQEFLLLLEQDLRAAGTPFVHQKKNRGSDKESDVDVEKGKERREKEELQVEVRVREVMEVVERVICSLFYDRYVLSLHSGSAVLTGPVVRLFMQATTDDASHDETLTSRIAALNMLDLSLQHLDVLVGDNGPDVEVVVMACGESKLSSSFLNPYSSYYDSAQSTGSLSVPVRQSSYPRRCSQSCRR
jgi:hypothetical protein